MSRAHREAYEKLLHGAERVINNDGRATASSSMDLDYGHDLIEEALKELVPKSLEDMQAEVVAWCHRKGWAGPGSPEITFGDSMALLHSEVSEALEAYRNWLLEDATERMAVMPACCAQSGVGACDDAPHQDKPEGVGSEFADILIRLLDDCDRYGIDLRAEYERKMAYNERRPYQHGGKRL